MIKYSKIHTDNIRIIQPRTRNKILFIFRTVLRIHKIVRSDLINNLDHPCPPPPYENNFFNIRRIVFVCEVCGKHHLRKFELERIENKFRASRMGKVDGRTDEPRPPRQCFTTNFLSRPVFSHGPPTLRPRKEVINPQEVNPPRGLTVLSRPGRPPIVPVCNYPPRLFVSSSDTRNGSGRPLDRVIWPLRPWKKILDRCSIERTGFTDGWKSYIRVIRVIVANILCTLRWLLF